MSTSAKQSSGGFSKLVLPIGLLLMILLGAYVFTRPPALDNSVLGLRGFVTVAEQKKDLNIRFLEGTERFNASDFGLRILPLYAPKLSPRPNEAKPGKDENEILRRLPSYVFRRKIRTVPTLVVLPKWREGALIREVLHPDLLIPKKSYIFRFLDLNKIGAAELRRGGDRIESVSVNQTDFRFLPDIKAPTNVDLYSAQLLTEPSIANPQCKPIINADGLTLLARCISNRSVFWLLTDPDVINNLGAGKGNNYAFAVGLVRTLAKGKPILVDGTTRTLTTSVRKKNERDRSFSDLARFFAYPFSLIWGALAVLAFFGIWHSWRRIGPVDDREDANAMLASKATAIEANVAILRGHGGRASRDAPLAATYVEQRVTQLAQDVLGEAAKGRNAVNLLLDALARRNDGLAQNLRNSISRLTNNSPTSEPLPNSTHPKTGDQNLFAALGNFETTLEEARHEFGRTANPR